MATTNDKSRPTAVPLSQVVGSRLRHFRTFGGLRQEDIASTAKSYGLDWSRSSVAMLEAGSRRLSAEELLLLPYIVRDAVLERSGGTGQILVALGELLEPNILETLALTPTFSLSRPMVRSWLGEAYPRKIRMPARSPGTRGRIGEAEQKTARALGVPLPRLLERAEDLWGRSLTEERDYRAAVRMFGEDGRRRAMRDLTPEELRSLQAVRAQVTRQLANELHEAFQEEGEE